MPRGRPKKKVEEPKKIDDGYRGGLVIDGGVEELFPATEEGLEKAGFKLVPPEKWNQDPRPTDRQYMIFELASSLAVHILREGTGAIAPGLSANVVKFSREVVDGILNGD